MSGKPAAPETKAATFLEKVGASERLWVPWRADTKPAFPPHCPCCLERPSPHESFRVRNETVGVRFDFPACAACVRHVAIDTKIIDATGIVVFILAVFTVAVFLVSRGGWVGLLEPFRGPIKAALTVGFGFVAMLIWTFAIRFVLIWPIEKALGLHKPSCRSTTTSPVRWGMYDKLRGKGLAFENVEYGRRFARAHGVPERP